MQKERKFLGSLYIRIATTFLLLLLVIGCINVFIVVNAATKYYQEVNQRLNVTIAEHIAAEIKPFLNDDVNTEALEDIFHNTMVLNPAIEIYLLDNEGKILSYFAPGKVIKLSSINLRPVNIFLKTKGQEFVCAPDPRNPEINKAFSAAEVKENGKRMGYIYVVLAGTDYDSIIELLKGSFFMRVGVFSFLLTLAAALLIGLFVVWILTRNLDAIIKTVKGFAHGNLNARIQIKSTSELAALANTFNEMADIIVSNIDKITAMEKVKSDLIANFSHDLRTPLAVIHGYIETLTLKEDSITRSERNRYMLTVMKNTQKLEKLVSDLFEISKLDSIQVQPKKEAFFITELISDILSKYHLLATQKQLKIITNIAPHLKRVYAGLSMIDRAIQNLVDNAIKFTNPGGEITIIVKYKDSAKVEVKICDNGTGIAPDVLPLIFNRFYTSGRNYRADDGSGLGLSIVKKIMENHATDITVSSDLGQGTIFTFWLDVYEESKPLSSEKLLESTLKNLTQKTQWL